MYKIELEYTIENAENEDEVKTWILEYLQEVLFNENLEDFKITEEKNELLPIY
jgi:hypothetical protein